MKPVINSKYDFLKDFLENLPSTFPRQGEVVYDARNQIRKITVGKLTLGVKSYKVPVFINRIIYSFFRTSKAQRAYDYATKLVEKGINTPDPVAYIEERKAGLLNRSFFVYIYQDNVSHIREEMLGHSGGKQFEKALASFIADMHNKGVLPLDMSPGNILWENDAAGNPVFSLIDFNRMAFMDDIPKELRYKSFKRISEDVDIISHLAQQYARLCNLDEQEAIKKIYNYCYEFSKEMKKKPKAQL